MKKRINSENCDDVKCDSGNIICIVYKCERGDLCINAKRNNENMNEVMKKK